MSMLISEHENPQEISAEFVYQFSKYCSLSLGWSEGRSNTPDGGTAGTVRGSWTMNTHTEFHGNLTFVVIILNRQRD